DAARGGSTPPPRGRKRARCAGAPGGSSPALGPPGRAEPTPVADARCSLHQPPDRRRAMTSSTNGALGAPERRTLAAMVMAVAGLHVVGFTAFGAVGTASPFHDREPGLLTIGIGLTPSTLGVRHAFHAAHISAI